MAVTIRLSRHGRTKLPFYRIVAADKQMKRDGRYLELLGTLNPLTDPPSVKLKSDRVKYWLSQGAGTSETLGKIIKREIPGYLEELAKGKKKKVQAKRAKRKLAAKGKAPSKKKVAAKSGEAKKGNAKRKAAKKPATKKVAKKA